MDFYRPIAKHIACRLYAWKDGGDIFRYLREFERSQYLPAEEIRQQQWRSVQAIVRHAYEHCPYYRRKYKEAGVHPDSLRELPDFAAVPPISKQEIQQNAAEMVADNVAKADIEENFTGGSTGQPLRLYVDRARRGSRSAGMVRHDRWAGLDLGDKVAYLWGATADLPTGRKLKAALRNWLAERALWLDTSRISPETIREFIRKLRRHRPKCFVAYAGSMALFARYVQETGQAASVAPQSIISSAEVLTDADRALIETTFACRIFNRYGCREASVLASECEQHSGMHVNAESVYLEFVHQGRPVAVGGLGRILLTDLRNLAMPLIRYEIGDAGSAADGICACGRGLPLMRMVAGRTTDFLVTASRQLVSGIVLATYVITKVPGALQVQFVQEQPGEVVVRVVAGEGFAAHGQKAILALLGERLGADTKLAIELVPDIPCASSGKFPFTVSRIDPLGYLV